MMKLFFAILYVVFVSAVLVVFSLAGPIFIFASAPDRLSHSVSFVLYYLLLFLAWLHAIASSRDITSSDLATYMGLRLPTFWPMILTFFLFFIFQGFIQTEHWSRIAESILHQ